MLIVLIVGTMKGGETPSAVHDMGKRTHHQALDILDFLAFEFLAH